MPASAITQATQRGSTCSPGSNAPEGDARSEAMRSARSFSTSERPMTSWSMPHCASTSWSKKWPKGPWPTSWRRPARRNVSSTHAGDGASGNAARSEASTRRAKRLARCIAPSRWTNRECSADGNTHHADCSWWTRRSRCNQGLSRRLRSPACVDVPLVISM